MHSRPENFQKSMQKNFRGQIDFWPFLKMRKMEFGQKIFREIDLFYFTSFFGLDYFNFSGSLQHPPKTSQHLAGISPTFLGLHSLPIGGSHDDSLGSLFQTIHKSQKLRNNSSFDFSMGLLSFGSN